LAVDRLAARLLLDAIPLARIGAAMDHALERALAPFLAAPGPGTFLRAHRAIRTHLRKHRLEGYAPAARALAGGLAAMRTAGLPPDLCELLAELPVDRTAGRRLHALAALTKATVELGSRVAAQEEELRQKWKNADAAASATARGARAVPAGTRTPGRAS
jgi:hypothetical protein